jgi:aminoglycoside phosphotransferase (APT) family kinase protein
VRNAVAKLEAAGIAARTLDEVTRRVSGDPSSVYGAIALSHGDVSVGNLFVDNGSISGAIDWEYAREDGLPALDMLAYLESRQRLAEAGSSVADNLLRLAQWEWPCDEEAAALRDLYAHFGVDAAHHETLCLLTWVVHASHQLDTTARFDPGSIERLAAPIQRRFTPR